MSFNQDDRFLRIEGPFSDDQVALRELQAEEHLSDLFKAELQLITDIDAPLSPDDVSGRLGHGRSAHRGGG